MKGTIDYSNLSMKEKVRLLIKTSNIVDTDKARLKIFAGYLRWQVRQECYRELMVSYLPMLPLIEEEVSFDEADYILYMHAYARCEDMSDYVVKELKEIAECRKEGAEIIVLGKAANAEKLLNGSISNITFWGDHFTEKLGKKFGFDIKEQYFVWDDYEEHLAIWPVDGCLQKCKFCRRCYMDIKFESLSLETIQENLNNIKEKNPERLRRISLRAENLTEYGIDIYGKQMLHELIKLLDSYQEIEEIEIPIGLCIGEMTEEIVNAICASNKIAGLAMNVEAGSNRLLKVIGKPHTREKAIEIFKRVRKAHPDMIISTNIMIGLPTEELQDILELVSLIEVIEVDNIYCSDYTCTPRQPLAKLPQISHALKQYHLKTLIKWLRDIKCPREFTIEFFSLDTHKRSDIRRKERVKKLNEETAKDGEFPRFYHDYLTYKP